MFETTCPFCNSRLRLSPASLGQQVRCPLCQKVFATRPLAVAAHGPPAAESPSDFSGGGSTPPDTPFDFSAPTEEVEERRQRRRASDSAAAWLKIAASLYFLLAALNALRTAGVVLVAGGAYGFGALLGGIAFCGLALALGLLLWDTAGALQRSRTRRPGRAVVAAVLALVAGVPALLLGLFAVVSSAGMFVLILRGGAFADRWAAPTLLVTGLLFLALGASSLMAGIKTLLVTRTA
jgi:hypothetical protein